MKKYLFGLFSLLFLFLSSIEASAHNAGQQSYFKINDVYVSMYPIPSSSLDSFSLPQDNAAQVYELNKPITFELDTSRLPVVDSTTVSKLKFTWDFGNGDTFTGVKTSYTYSRMGSYILTIMVSDTSSAAPVLLESVMLHIVPNKSYKLPKAVISINGTIAANATVPFSNPVAFDASSSKPGSAPITSFFWDYGDMRSSTDKTDSHAYASDLHVVFPVLRVTDANGIISDAYVQLTNQTADNPLGDQKGTTHTFTIAILAIIALLSIASVFFYKKGKSNYAH